MLAVECKQNNLSRKIAINERGVERLLPCNGTLQVHNNKKAIVDIINDANKIIDESILYSDPAKVKLTHVSGAVLCEYVDKQLPTEIQYEIGEENMDSGPPSEESEASDSESSSDNIQVTIRPTTRPKTATNKDRGQTKPNTDNNQAKGNNLQANEDKLQAKHVKFEDLQVNDEVQAKVTKDDLNAVENKQYDTMINVDREDAKRSIIKTINSYEDERFPSQGKQKSL